MLRIVILLLSILVSSSSCNSDDDNSKPKPSVLIDSRIESIMKQKHIAGVSAVIVKGGEVVWINSYGYANTDLKTPFTNTTPLILASVSKLFTGTAIMQLVEKGTIQLDEAIDNYLPFAFRNPNFQNQPITFKMLLTHTSSISDSDALDNFLSNGDPTISLAESIKSYFSTSGNYYDATKNFNNNQPGTFFEYSNMGTALSGYLVELISEIPFNQYCNQNIFNKLCMDDTKWFLSEYNDVSRIARPHTYNTTKNQFIPLEHIGFADYPNGMLHSTVTDLENYMIALLQKGQFNGKSILTGATIDEILKPQISNLDPDQGLQFANIKLGNTSLWGHIGAIEGISTNLFIDKDNDLGIVVLKNSLDESDLSGLPIAEILYNYGLKLSTSGIGNPKCTSH